MKQLVITTFLVYVVAVTALDLEATHANLDVLTGVQTTRSYWKTAKIQHLGQATVGDGKAVPGDFDPEESFRDEKKDSGDQLEDEMHFVFINSSGGMHQVSLQTNEVKEAAHLAAQSRQFREMPQNTNSTEDFKRVVFSPDLRFRQTRMDRYPNFYMVRIEDIGCSGTIIGPNEVLTAAHCLYLNGALQQELGGRGIRVYPARDENLTPYGEFRVVGMRLPQRWVSHQDFKEDYAVLFVDRPFSQSGIQGVMPYGWNPALGTGSWGQLRGYPKDKAGGTQLWWSWGNMASQTTSEVFYCRNLDTFGGVSGAGLYFYYIPLGRVNPTYVVTGVHSGARNLGRRRRRKLYNYHVRITPAKFYAIFAWVAIY